MLLDDALEFTADAGTALATATGRALVADVIDTSVARDIGNHGNGLPLYLVILVTDAVTSAGAATVTFELVSDAQAAIAVDGSATIHHSTGAIGKATLVAGYSIVIPLPAEGVAYERYLGLISNPGTAALTAGSIRAFITPDAGKWKSYPDAL